MTERSPASPPLKRENPKLATVRDFLRNLNVLLKSCRLYGIDHVRTTAQLKTAWDHLLAGLHAQGGMQIAVAGSRLMIDGEALKSTPAESSFAEMVSGAGISSIEFTPRASQEEFAKFVRAFANSGPKFEGLSGLLQQALGESSAAGIRVNEFRVVAADAAGESGQAQARMAGEAMAKALGADLGELKDALADPQKLLALIAAAEGADARVEGQAGAGPGSAASSDAAPGATLAGNASERGTHAPAPGAVYEQAAFRMLSQLGQTVGTLGAPIDPQHFQQQVAALPLQGRQVLQEALAGLAAESPTGAQDPLLLIKLAERLALRIAMKRFERGDAKVDAVQEMLSRMGREIDRLRTKLATYESQAQEAQKELENPERLVEQFWAILPAEDKLRTLLSPQAFDLPSQHIRKFLEQVPRRGDVQTPRTVLEHYVEGAAAEDSKTRLRVLEGITDLADLFAAAGDQTLERALAAIGAQLLAEQEVELQNALSSALVHLSQLAADSHHYGALQEAMAQTSALAHHRPDIANALRPRIGMENRVPHLVEEALKKPTLPQHLLEVLKEMPRAAALQTANQFNQATEIERSDRVFALATALGPAIADVLRETLRSSPDSEALLTIGLLTRLEIGAVGELLPARLPRWNHSYQNQVVRQIASSGATGRGELLAQLIDRFDPLDVVSAVDEIGMCGDSKAAPRLLRIAAGELPAGWPAFLRIKAIEALGRLRAKDAVPILRKIVEEKKLWIWGQPRELRVLALQALLKIEPEWAQKFVPESGLTADELALAPREPTPDWAGVRQRCYERITPRRTLKAKLLANQQEFVVTIVDMSLGGAFAMGAVSVPPGTRAEFILKAGTAEVKAVVLIRGMRKGGVNFEIVDITFEERSKFRRLLIDIQKEPG
jgi:hypothetical protein